MALAVADSAESLSKTIRSSSCPVSEQCSVVLKLFHTASNVFFPNKDEFLLNWSLDRIRTETDLDNLVSLWSILEHLVFASRINREKCVQLLRKSSISADVNNWVLAVLRNGSAKQDIVLHSSRIVYRLCKFAKSVKLPRPQVHQSLDCLKHTNSVLLKHEFSDDTIRSLTQIAYFETTWAIGASSNFKKVSFSLFSTALPDICRILSRYPKQSAAYTWAQNVIANLLLNNESVSLINTSFASVNASRANNKPQKAFHAQLFESLYSVDVAYADGVCILFYLLLKGLAGKVKTRGPSRVSPGKASDAAFACFQSFTSILIQSHWPYNERLSALSHLYDHFRNSRVKRGNLDSDLLRYLQEHVRSTVESHAKNGNVQILCTYLSCAASLDVDLILPCMNSVWDLLSSIEIEPDKQSEFGPFLSSTLQAHVVSRDFQTLLITWMKRLSSSPRTNSLMHQPIFSNLVSNFTSKSLLPHQVVHLTNLTLSLVKRNEVSDTVPELQSFLEFCACAPHADHLLLALNSMLKSIYMLRPNTQYRSLFRDVFQWLLHFVQSVSEPDVQSLCYTLMKTCIGCESQSLYNTDLKEESLSSALLSQSHHQSPEKLMFLLSLRNMCTNFTLKQDREDIGHRLSLSFSELDKILRDALIGQELSVVQKRDLSFAILYENLVAASIHDTCEAQDGAKVGLENLEAITEIIFEDYVDRCRLMEPSEALQTSVLCSIELYEDPQLTNVVFEVICKQLQIKQISLNRQLKVCCCAFQIIPCDALTPMQRSRALALVLLALKQNNDDNADFSFLTEFICHITTETLQYNQDFNFSNLQVISEKMPSAALAYLRAIMNSLRKEDFIRMSSELADAIMATVARSFRWVSNSNLLFLGSSLCQCIAEKKDLFDRTEILSNLTQSLLSVIQHEITSIACAAHQGEAPQDLLMYIQTITSVLSASNVLDENQVAIPTGLRENVLRFLSALLCGDDRPSAPQVCEQAILLALTIADLPAFEIGTGAMLMLACSSFLSYRTTINDPVEFSSLIDAISKLAIKLLSNDDPLLIQQLVSFVLRPDSGASNDIVAGYNLLDNVFRLSAQVPIVHQKESRAREAMIVSCSQFVAEAPSISSSSAPNYLEALNSLLFHNPWVMASETFDRTLYVLGSSEPELVDTEKDAAIFMAKCHLLSTLQYHQKSRILKRFPQYVGCFQGLLKQLCILSENESAHADTDRLADCASTYSRVLASLADRPTSSAKKSQDKDLLDSKEHRFLKVLRNYAIWLFVDFLQLSVQVKIPAILRVPLMPGFLTLYSLFTSAEREMINGAIDSTARVLFRQITRDFQRDNRQIFEA